MLDDPPAAVQSALDGQLALAAEPWPEPAFEVVYPSQQPRPPTGMRVRVLGGLAFDAGGTELAPPAGRRSRALLGWLAIHPGMHSRSAVAGRFWPDVPESRARTSLRTALSELRRSLGPAGAEVLQAGPEEVGLAGDALWVDVRAFEELARAERLEEAVALCRGELLAGLDDEWVLEEREAHRARLSELLGRLTAAARAEGAHHRARRWARARAELDPLGESAQRDLIRALADTGDRPAAVLAYDRLRRRLNEELGLAPSLETRLLAEELVSDQAPPAAAVGRPALPLPLATGEVLELVGRRAELEALRRRLREARQGALRVVLLAGQPGIGKTRLVRELCMGAHTEGAVVLLGRCYEESLTPYQPIVEALRRYVAATPSEVLSEQTSEVGGEIAALIPELRRRVPGLQDALSGDPEGERYRLFEAVVQLLAAVTRAWPAVLVLEDLHWADSSTALLLAHVVRASAALPLLIVGTYRQIELAPGSPLARAMADLRRDQAFERIGLEGLGSDDVGTLIAEWAGRQPPPEFARTVHDETEGNPFFVQEILRHLADSGAIEPEAGRWAATPSDPSIGVPEGIGEAVQRRLSALGEEARATLVAASILGRGFSVAQLESLDDLTGDRLLAALEEAVEAHAITESAETPGSYSFAHALIRETLYRSLGITRRARLHARVAAALERLYAGDVEAHLGELAHHHMAALEPGASPDKAVEYSRRAGERAALALSFEESAAHHARALRALERDGRGDGADACDVLLALGDAQRKAGEPKLARAASRRAAEIAERCGLHEQMVAAALAFAGPWARFTATEADVVALLERALSTPATDRLRPRLLARLGMELHSRDPARGVALTEEATRLARAADDPETLAFCLNAHLWGNMHARLLPGVAAELVATAAEAGEAELELQGHYWRVVELIELGEVPDADAEIAQTFVVAERLRQPYYRSAVAGLPVTRALMDGRFDDAERLARAAMASCQAAGNFNGFCAARFQLAARAWEIGPRKEDAEDLERFIDAHMRPQIGVETDLVSWHTMGIMLLCAAGCEDEARARLLAHPVDELDAACRERRRGVLWNVAEVVRHLGDRELAARLRPAAVHPPGEFLVSGRGAAVVLCPTERPLGLLDLALERWQDAVAELEAALAASERVGALPLVARTRLDMARALLGRGADGDAARARGLLDSANELATRLGMVAVARDAALITA